MNFCLISYEKEIEVIYVERYLHLSNKLHIQCEQLKIKDNN